MSKVKTSKKRSVLKTVGLVFMIVTLLAALSLTNNRVRQFITDSLAYDPVCAAKGSPSARRACQEPIDEARAAAARAARSEAQRNQNQDTRLKNSGVDGPNFNEPIIYEVGNTQTPTYENLVNTNVQIPSGISIPNTINSTNITPSVKSVINDLLKRMSLNDILKAMMNAGR